MNTLNPYTHARLTCGAIVRLSKDCSCITHDGPHWQHADQSWKEANRALLDKSPRGFAAEESARLGALACAFQAEGIAQLLTADQCAGLEIRRGVRASVRRLLGCSLNEASQHASGRTLRGFVAIWEWSAPRMGGSAGRKHDAFWEKHGKEKYYRRINRVRAACGFAALANTGAA